jgi:hypothetical protein
MPDDQVVDLVERRIQAAVVELRQYFQEQLKAQGTLAEEKWAGWKLLDAAAVLLADTRIRGLERALDIHTAATDRRLTGLDHEYDRLGKQVDIYVRKDVYDKEMERLYAEKQAQNAAARDARIHAEAAAATNRRSLTMGIIGFIITIMIATVSVVLPFLRGHG